MTTAGLQPEVQMWKAASARQATAGRLPRVAEFFAGIGLMRSGFEVAGFEVVWANDISAAKARLYRQNFADDHFLIADVRDVRAGHLPAVDVATASFPCTDLSLAGDRAGLAGGESGLFWEFERVLRELGEGRPRVVLLENVAGLATSHHGQDLVSMIRALNAMGYVCDIVAIDARNFVPQSRPRLFIVAASARLPWAYRADGNIRPAWAEKLARSNPDLKLGALPAPALPVRAATLASIVECLPTDDARWWDAHRAGRFRESLSPIQFARAEALRSGPATAWRTAYRRTRNSVPVWEIRDDEIAGCLRTARGGSSKQAIVEAGRGEFRVRWLTARECARLQGADGFALGAARTNEALFGFGDAVCVPAVAWVATHLVRPALELTHSQSVEARDA